MADRYSPFPEVFLEACERLNEPLLLDLRPRRAKVVEELGADAPMVEERDLVGADIFKRMLAALTTGRLVAHARSRAQTAQISMGFWQPGVFLKFGAAEINLLAQGITPLVNGR